MNFKLLTVLIFCFCCGKSIMSQSEFNTILMNSTYKIYGFDRINTNLSTIGTCFIIGRPVANDSVLNSFVLITAKHILEDINNDFAFVELRIKNIDDSYFRIPWEIPLMENKKPLWSQYKKREIDVAAMYIELPDTFLVHFRKNFLSMNYLSDDSTFKTLEMHPGDELFSLGYPEGIPSNDFGFPILRSGIIASYPVFPSSLVSSFLLDAEVYSGNSGGPVYMYQVSKVYQNVNYFKTIATIVGIMTDQILYKDERKINDSLSINENKPLKLAKVIPGHFIKEVINSLPVIINEKK